MRCKYSISDLSRWSGCFAPQLVVRDFDITQTLQLRNNIEMPLHFRLGTQPPFLVLKPQPRARTSNSSNPPTGDSQYLVLQPQHSMQVRCGEAVTFWMIYNVDTERFWSEGGFRCLVVALFSVTNRWHWPSTALHPFWTMQTRQMRKSLLGWRWSTVQVGRGSWGSSKTSWFATATTACRSVTESLKWVWIEENEYCAMKLICLCSVQTVPLHAHLDLTTIRLSTDSIDFGFCYVEQTLTIEVNLYSHGAHTYWKSLIG